MGFEVLYQYHERLEDGSYDKDIKTMKKKVGKVEEEISHDKLAGTIMAQLARRDIWVIDVEVYEFTKKKLSFKETKGGLVIGNRRYNLDACEHLSVQESDEVVSTPPPAIQVKSFKPSFQTDLPAISEDLVRNANGMVNVADLQLLKKKPLRYEVFQPDPTFVDMSKVRTLAFTVGEKYPIYAEKPAGNDNRLGMNYTTLDNNGQKQVLNDKHFLPVGILIGGSQFNEKRDIDLYYGDDGGHMGAMPKLR
jgi:hypothetical protein